MRRSFLPFLVMGASLCGQEESLGRVWFVKSDAAGVNSGQTWVDAFVDLSDALAAAEAGDEVWIAGGTYRPDRGTGNRQMSFQIPCGVHVFGGFAGWESSPDQRQHFNLEAILSGDLEGDDQSVDCRKFSNCCTEHDGLGCDDPWCEELVCMFVDPNCCSQGSNPEKWTEYCAEEARVLCCELAGKNTCENSLVVATVSDCDDEIQLDGIVFENSSYIGSRDSSLGGLGAGLLAVNSSIKAVNCAFRGNEPSGIFTIDSALIVDACGFVRNGEGVYGTAEASFRGCLFRENRTGVRVHGPANYANSLFDGNDTWGLHCRGGKTTIDHCAITRNGQQGIYSRGLLNLVDSIIADNNAGGLSSGGPVIARRSRFSRNRNQPALSISNAPGLFQDCLFDNGSHQGFNSVVYLSASPVEFRHCTFAHNLGRDIPGQISTLASAGPSPVTLTNCIFWVGDEVSRPPDDLLQAYHPGASFTVNNSIIQWWSGAMGGIGNSGQSPQFIDADGPDDIPGNDDDDFRLAPGSPAINLGNPAFVPESGETDLDGHARVLCGRVDMGAYEFGIGDYDCDQAVDLADLAAWEQCMGGPVPPSPRPSPLKGEGDGPDPPSSPSPQRVFDLRKGGGCEAFDVNADGDNDLADFGYLQRVFVVP